MKTVLILLGVLVILAAAAIVTNPSAEDHLLETGISVDVENYRVLSIGSVSYGDRSEVVSIGMFGKVITTKDPKVVGQQLQFDRIAEDFVISLTLESASGRISSDQLNKILDELALKRTAGYEVAIHYMDSVLTEISLQELKSH